jgi:adenosine deaminase
MSTEQVKTYYYDKDLNDKANQYAQVWADEDIRRCIRNAFLQGGWYMELRNKRLQEAAQAVVDDASKPFEGAGSFIADEFLNNLKAQLNQKESK